MTPAEKELIRALQNAEKKARRLAVQLEIVTRELEVCRFSQAHGANDLYLKFGIGTHPKDSMF